MGLVITGVFAGGRILSVTSNVSEVFASGKDFVEQYPYKPHYSMVIRQGLCIDCERCLKACKETNSVPDYGYRTRILTKIVTDAVGRKREFIPILCNHCNNPPCVRVCPTNATFKDPINGIVRMNPDKCIGCKTCMTACPYNARYFNEENRAIDKCDFCYDTKLKESNGRTTACAAACPANVRIFGDLTDPGSEVYKLIHAPGKVLWVLRPETETLPNVFYMNA